jgi:hypothetical protein
MPSGLPDQGQGGQGQSGCEWQATEVQQSADVVRKRRWGVGMVLVRAEEHLPARPSCVRRKKGSLWNGSIDRWGQAHASSASGWGLGT